MTALRTPRRFAEEEGMTIHTEEDVKERDREVADALQAALDSEVPLSAARDLMMRLRAYPESYFAIRGELEAMSPGGEATVHGVHVTCADSPTYGRRYTAEIGSITHIAGAPMMAMLIRALAEQVTALVREAGGAA